MNPLEPVNPFSYYKPDDSLIPLISETREAYKKTWEHIYNLPLSRERSLAITALEESAMWAIKGIVLPKNN